MAGVWRDRGCGCWEFLVAGFKGGVHWNMTKGPNGENGYIASFEGHKYKRRFDDLEKAKTAVEELALKRAKELLDVLTS